MGVAVGSGVVLEEGDGLDEDGVVDALPPDSDMARFCQPGKSPARWM